MKPRASPQVEELRRTMTLEDGGCGTFVLVAPSGKSLFVQSDWDFPAVAQAFGWSPCSCRQTDGTIDCEHESATEMIAEAGAFLLSRVGETVEDPGYF